MVHVDRGRGALHGCRLPRAGSNAESVYGSLFRDLLSSVSVATGRDGRSGVPPVSTLSGTSQFFQDEATEQIKECGFHVKNIEDKRLGAEVMYLRFHQWHRRPNSRPNSKSSKPARRGRGRPDYMRGRPPSCEHCSQCFRGGSLAITCPFDTCGNLHWTCLRPHAEQCHPSKCV